MIKGFKEFVFRGNVIDLAVAVAVGTALAALVAAVTKALIEPIVGWILSLIGGSDGIGGTITLSPGYELNFALLIGALHQHGFEESISHARLQTSSTQPKGGEPTSSAAAASMARSLSPVCAIWWCSVRNRASTGASFGSRFSGASRWRWRCIVIIGGSTSFAM